MNCGQCDAPLDDGDRFCWACGAGAPARAAVNYATAAELAVPGTGTEPAGTADNQLDAAVLWERAARATSDSGSNFAVAIEQASRARDLHLERNQTRAAARARAIAGRALRQLGRFTEARDQLVPAVEVLRAEPDTDTVRALEELAMVETFAGSPDADKLTTEALVLGQAVDVSLGQLSGLLVTRGIYLFFAERVTEAIAFLREAARLAEAAGDHQELGSALLNLAVALADPEERAEISRTAAGHLRRVGNLDYLAYAIGNLGASLFDLGDWDGWEAVLAEAAISDEMAENYVIRVPPWPTWTPSACVLRPKPGRWPLAWPFSCTTARRPVNCSRCSIPIRPGGFPRCCAPSATWRGHAWPPALRAAARPRCRHRAGEVPRGGLNVSASRHSTRHLAD